MITLIGNTSLTKLEKYINDVNLIGSFYVQEGRETQALGYVYTLRLIGPISYLGACYIRTKVTKCICEKMTLHFRGLTIKSHSPGYEIGPINRSV